MCRLAPAFRAVRKFLGSPLQCPFTLCQAQNYSQHLKLIQGDQAQLAPTVVLNGESLPVPGGEYNATPHLDVRYAQGTSVKLKAVAKMRPAPSPPPPPLLVR